MLKLRSAAAGVSVALLSCVGASVQAQAPAATIIWNAPDDKAAKPAADAPPVVVASPCTDAAAPVPAPEFGGPWRTRLKATGDWGGFRNELACNGITLDASLTQFYQGVESGGRDQDYFYGGRLDYYLNIDGEKAGLMKGSFINLHAETIYGVSANAAAGTIFPVSVGQIFPVPDESITALTGVKYTQFLSQNVAVFGGKLNTLDEFKQQYAGGRGTDAFMNLSFALPVVVARTIPYSTWGGGFAVLNDNQEVIFTGGAFDTNNTPTSTGFNTFFDNGVTFLAMATLPVNFNGLPGHQGIGATYSTGTYRSIDRNSYFDPTEPNAMLPANRQEGSWSLFYLFDQALFADCCNPKRTWGIFGNLGIADDNPSPIRWAGNIGFGGASLFTSRQYDSWGVGYFHNGLSQNLKDFAPRLSELGDESGIEVFYNLGITPYCHITPDFQVILPGRERFDTAFLLGIRMKIDF